MNFGGYNQAHHTNVTHSPPLMQRCSSCLRKHEEKEESFCSFSSYGENWGPQGGVTCERTSHSELREPGQAVAQVPGGRARLALLSLTSQQQTDNSCVHFLSSGRVCEKAHKALGKKSTE